MANDKEQFQSIYGDAESEFEMEDVSDETLSISKEEIEAAVAEEEAQPEPAEEQTAEGPAAAAEEPAAEEPAASAEEPAEEEPKEEPAAEAPATEETSPAEETASADQEEPAEREEPEDDASDITFEDHAYETHGHHGHDDDDDPDDVYTDKSEEETDDEKVGVISYILHAILFTIPVIGTIVMLVYIISDRKNSHLRHFAQIWLVTLLLIAIGIYAAIMILGIA